MTTIIKHITGNSPFVTELVITKQKKIVVIIICIVLPLFSFQPRATLL